VGLTFAESKKTILFHLKTSLKHDDAQICVAYNQIWAALEEGLNVNVLIDADAVNTYKVGWFGKDGIEKFKLPENLKSSLSQQFGLKMEDIPATYGDYLHMLRQKGAQFYINSSMLVVAGIEEDLGAVDHLSAPFFKPLGLREMIRLRKEANLYMAY
jgi:hypothetical protein